MKVAASLKLVVSVSTLEDHEAASTAVQHGLDKPELLQQIASHAKVLIENATGQSVHVEAVIR